MSGKIKKPGGYNRLSICDHLVEDLAGKQSRSNISVNNPLVVRDGVMMMQLYLLVIFFL